MKKKAFNPAFDEKDYKRINKQYKESINNSKKSAQNMARQAVMKLIYGNTIRGIMPSVKSIEKLNYLM